jgi:4-amino-4-deoxy-L-arabinose transferase-like glycosyltransferase
VRQWRDAHVAVVVACAVALLLALTAQTGFVRDEGYYFRAATDYHRWFEELWKNLWAGELGASFAEPALRRAFSYNTEHPGLVKILMGFTHKVFSVWLGAPHALGFRLASIGLVAAGAACTYLFAAARWSRGVGILAVVLLFLCPHVFFHAHLACFDGPIMGLTVVVVWVFWRSLASRSIGLALGLT